MIRDQDVFLLRKTGAALPLWQGVVLSRALLASLLLHVMLLVMWPVLSVAGKPAGGMRATLRGGVIPASQHAEKTANPQIPAPAAGMDRSMTEASRKTSPSSAASGPQALSEQGGHMPADDYIPTELLDEKPAFLQDPAVYGSSLPDAERGKIVLQLLISESGRVDNVVLESSGLSAEATRRFMQQLGAASLLPGVRDAKPVKSRWRMEFTFEPVSPTNH